MQPWHCEPSLCRALSFRHLSFSPALSPCCAAEADSRHPTRVSRLVPFDFV